MVYVLCSYLSFAQTCKIKYDYDNAGNRIARYEWCPGGVNGPGGNKAEEIAEASQNEEVLEATQMHSGDDLEVAVLFPNPTSSTCIVSLNKEVTSATLTLIDNQGKKVHTMRVSGKDIPLDLSGFTSGTYFVIIRTETRTVNKIVMKN